MTILDEPRLFQTPETRTAFQEGLKATIREHLNKKWNGGLNIEIERLLSGYTRIGINRPVDKGTKLVRTDYAVRFLKGEFTKDQLMDSSLTLLDNTSNWSQVKVEDQTGFMKQETPYFFPLSDFDNAAHPIDANGYYMQVLGPENADPEYRQHERTLFDMLGSTENSVPYLFRSYGFSEQAQFVENRLEEIGRAYVERWIDALGERFKRFTISPDKIVKPSDLKGKLFFSVIFNGPLITNASLKKVLDPDIWVRTGELCNNRIQEVTLSGSGDTNPERVDRTMKGFLVYRKDFRALKAELDAVIETATEVKRRLSPQINMELRSILLASVRDVLGIVPYTMQKP